MELLTIHESEPNSAHSAIAELASIEAYKTELNRHIKQVDGRRKYIEQFLLEESKKDINTRDGIPSQGLLAGVVREKIGVVTDWDAIHEYTVKTRDFYFFKKDAISSRILEAYENAYDWDVRIVKNDLERMNPNYGQILVALPTDSTRGCFSVCKDDIAAFDYIDWGDGVSADSSQIDFINRLMAEGIIPSPPPGTGIITREKIKLTKIK